MTLAGEQIGRETIDLLAAAGLLVAFASGRKSRVFALL